MIPFRLFRFNQRTKWRRAASCAPWRPVSAQQACRISAAEQLEPRLLLTTLIVDDDFLGLADGELIAGGTVGVNRFATIQAGIDVGSAGDTVQVRSGSYGESVSINKSLVVESMGSVTVMPPTAADAIRIESGDVTLRGITIRSARHGVFATTTGLLGLQDIRTLDNSGHGVRVELASSITIDGLTSTGNQLSGIRLMNVGTVKLIGTVRANDNAQAGLDVLHASGVSIETGLFSGIELRDVGTFTTSTQTITSAGRVLIDADNSIELNGTINAGEYEIAIRANADGLGSDSLIMSAGARLVTTNDSATAVAISVNNLLGGTGNARLGLVSAGLLNSVSSHVTVSVIGGAIVDANDSLDNIVAGSALLEGQRGVGVDRASVIPADPIDTSVRMLRGAGGQGGFYVKNGGPLTLGENGLQHAVRTMGGAHVEIEARGALTIARDVMAGGRLELRARDAYTAGDDLTIRAGADVSANGSILLSAGDDLFVEANSRVESTQTTILIQVDRDNFDEEIGSVVRISGVVDSLRGTTIAGGRDADRVYVSQVGRGGFVINGSSGDDEVTINYPSLPMQFGSEIIVDDGGGGEDIVIVNGTPERDVMFLTTDDGLIINDFDRVTRIDAHTEPITIRDNIEELRINTGDGMDIAHIQPSSLFRVTVDGGAPCFGHPGTPPGDVFDFQPLGNQFAITDRSFVTHGFNITYPPVQFSGFETLPVTELGIGAPQLFDFNHTNTASSVGTSPTQTGYTSVRADTLFSDGLGYGWQAAVSSFERNDGFYNGPLAALIQDGHSLGKNATFTAKVAGAGYYYLSALIGSPYTDVADVQIRNEDSQKVIVTDIVTRAGESTVVNFVAYTNDGTLDITFINSLQAPTIFGLNSLSIRPAQLLTMGLDTCDLSPLLADGVTVDSLQLHGAAPNAFVTVSATLGTIRNVDLDDELRGIQLQADSNGRATVELQRGFGLGKTFIKLEDVQGRGLGHATLDYFPPN